MRWAILGVGLCLSAAPAFAADQAVSAQLIRLHDDLRLTPAQESAWTAYTRAIGPSPNVEQRHRATDQLLPLVPTPRRIALIAATLAADEADFRRQGEAVNAFYAQLTPAQQRTFDAETLPTREGSP